MSDKNLEQRVKELEQNQRSLLDDVVLILLTLPFGGLIIWIFAALTYYSERALSETKLFLQSNEYTSRLMACFDVILPKLTPVNDDISMLAQTTFFNFSDIREQWIVILSLIFLVVLFQASLLLMKYILKFVYSKIKNTNKKQLQ